MGTTRSILFESENKNGFISGFTDNYIKAVMSFSEDLCNKIVQAELMGLNEQGFCVAQINEKEILSELPVMEEPATK
jgi:threonylcarbamoyladenosine tRNA methylthiotransferase MtaB